MVSARVASFELLASALLFGLSAWLAKRATQSLSGSEVAFWRFVIGLVFVFGQSWLRRVPLAFHRYDILFLRGLFGAGAGLLYFLALAEIPVGTATLLNCTSPVFAALAAVVFLRERMPWARTAALAVAGLGVVLVVVGQGATLGGPYAWQLAALASGLMAGGAVVTIRAARRYNGAWEIFFFFNLMGLVATTPFALRSWVWPDGGTWLLLLVMGAVMTLAQVLMNHALGAAPASYAAAVIPLTPVTSFALGMTFDGEMITTLSLCGGALTLLGVTWVARQNAGVAAAPPQASGTS